MEIALLTGPKKFNIISINEWNNFINSDENEIIKLCDLNALIELSDTICSNLEGSVLGSKFTIFQKIIKKDFKGWEYTELNDLLEEINVIIDKFSEITILNQVKRQVKNGKIETCYYSGEESEELKQKLAKKYNLQEFNTLYDANYFILNTIQDTINKVNKLKKSIILISIENDKIQQAGISEIENPFKDNKIPEDETSKKDANIIRSSANWFIWLGILSIINSIFVLFMPKKLGFSIGFALSQIVDYLSVKHNLINPFLALIIDILVSSIFVFLGFYSRKKYNWAFLTGMILYFIDSLYFMVEKQFISVIIHAVILIWIFIGFRKSLNSKN